MAHPPCRPASPLLFLHNRCFCNIVNPWYERPHKRRQSQEEHVSSSAHVPLATHSTQGASHGSVRAPDSRSGGEPSNREQASR